MGRIWVGCPLRVLPKIRPLETAEVFLRVPGRFATFRTSLFALASLTLIHCTASDAPTDTLGQAVINTPLPSDLNLVLNAKTSVTVGPFAQVFGDVGSAALDGSVLFDVSSMQGSGQRTLATTVAVKILAQVGHVYGNDITVDGFATDETLGIDPTRMPAVPPGTVAIPGTTDVDVVVNQMKQLCPGQYGTISLAANATLNLNGGVYEVSELDLAEGAKLEPSEPVVILVSGGMTTGVGSVIAPYPQLVNPMSAADIRIEVGGAVSIGGSSQVSAHVLAPNGRFTLGANSTLSGAVWARAISIGAQSLVLGAGTFAATAPSVPPPCNDNTACTVDQCVGGGTTVAFCRNTPAPSGTVCGDGDVCSGVATCDGVGQCQPGTIAGAGTSCSDGDACDGAETCDGAGTCVSGPAPVVNDGNACTVDVCDPVTGVSHNPVPDGTPCGGTGVCSGGTCTVHARTLYAINDTTQHLERIDPTTFAVTDIGPLGVPYAFGDCMFNPADQTLYMVDGRGNFGLYRVNLTTGAASLVGLHGVSAMEAIAYHPPTNKVYSIAIDAPTNFYALSTTTGAATAIGPVAGRFQAMAWDSTRNMMVAFDGVTLFSVDVTTGGMTAIANPTAVVDYGMTYDESIDRYWVVDFNNQILQLDPNAGFATTRSGFLSGPHTCIASVPVP